MAHIFISYSRADKDCAYKLQRQLEAQGFKIWIDKNDIPAGAAFPMEILQAIRTAAAVLIVWSEKSAASHFVGKEIEEALNQKMMRSMPVIPLWVDGHPLHPQLEALNAINLSGCSNDAIDGLVNRLSHLRYRHMLDFDPDKPLGYQGSTALKHNPSLVSLPLVESVYCKGRIIAEPNMSLAAAKNHPSKTVQVYLEFLGNVGNEDNISTIYRMLQTHQPGSPFFMFHFTGHQIGTAYALVDDPDNSPHGDWLDPVNTVYSTLEQILGRGGVTLQVFNAIPASLNFAIGMQFFKYWHVQLFHYSTRSQRYQLVLDTADL